jgi:hypothetical protein
MNADRDNQQMICHLTVSQLEVIVTALGIANLAAIEDGLDSLAGRYAGLADTLAAKIPE